MDLPSEGLCIKSEPVLKHLLSMSLPCHTMLHDLQEIEEEEGGPVKESLVGMAHVKRADARKAQEKKAMDDTEVPAEVEKFEEEAEVRQGRSRWDWRYVPGLRALGKRDRPPH